MYGFEKLGSDIASIFTAGLMQFRVQDIIDIILVTIVIYMLIMLTKDTRAMQVIKGLGMLVIASFIAQAAQLQALEWLLSEVLRVGAVAILILFQPELRRALEQIGRGSVLEQAGFVSRSQDDSARIVEELTVAMESLASRRVGALIVIEGNTGLSDILSTGTRIHGIISAAILENIFEPNTPLHDGAVIIQGSVLMGAGCFLPLTESTSISRQLGTRHRAALGVSEVSDCLAFIVSEETGIISVAISGKLTRYLDSTQIRNILSAIYTPVDQPNARDRLRAFKEKHNAKK